MTYVGPPEKGLLKVQKHDVVLSSLALTIPCLIVMLMIYRNDESTSSMTANVDEWNVHLICGSVLIFIQIAFQITNYNSIAKFLAAVLCIDKRVR